MKALLIKDIKFNIKYIILSIIISILYPIFYLDGTDSSLIIGLTLIPFLSFAFFIGKLCFIESRDNAYKYLESLPIKKNYFILSKFLEGIIVIITSFLIIIIENNIINILLNTSLHSNYQQILYCLSFLIIYIGIYFVLYYKYDYQVATQLICFVYVGLLFLFKFMISKNFWIINILSYNCIITFILSLIFYGVLYKICIHIYINKDN